MKRALSFMLMIFLQWTTSFSVTAEMPQRIFDNARIYSNDGPDGYIAQRAQIEEKKESYVKWIRRFREEYGYDFAVITIDDFIGYGTHAALAEAFYEQMELGVGPNKSGVLYLIDVNQQCVYLYTEGDCDEWMTAEIQEAVVADLEKHIKAPQGASLSLASAIQYTNSAWRAYFMGSEFVLFFSP